MSLRALTGLLALLCAVPALAQQPAAAQADEDSVWLSSLLMSAKAQDAQRDFMHCIDRVILSNPDAGIVTDEVAHPGLSEFVFRRVEDHIDRRFAQAWSASASELTARLAQYPAAQRSVVRAFFESSTGSKLIAYTETAFAQREIAVEWDLGFDQCLPPQPDWAAFDAQLTPQDRQAFARFPADPGNMLTPGVALGLASQIGGNSASQAMDQLVSDFEQIVVTARRDFLAGQRTAAIQ